MLTLHVHVDDIWSNRIKSTGVKPSHKSQTPFSQTFLVLHHQLCFHRYHGKVDQTL